MSKPISSYPVDQRSAIVARRIKANTSGMGYWAAMDFAAKMAKGVSKPKSK